MLKKKVVKVTFEVPPAALPVGLDVVDIHLVGEFNDWAADEYTPNNLGEDNCVVMTPTIESKPIEESE